MVDLILALFSKTVEFAYTTPLPNKIGDTIRALKRIDI